MSLRPECTSVLRDQHLSVDEAWAIAVKMADEYETVVCTQEIMDAWQAARSVLDLVDDVGARMAFLAAYERFSKCGKPKWLISQGRDKSLQLARVSEAVMQGRLPDSVLTRFPRS
ncbi:hypothetical protein [Methylomicrobium sp. Wu6]|uniref:hypothetical protein n=1 Tax=Methylomicrobium sp. Wu6 TaxID=3107928 RepID=UPI002DD6954C|nr:hypothetical protein [Methylomicrobium sp. Wu6]MEC4749011.1 hypothetical protein [Methylomicrobium sp. Wu6]